MESKISNRYLSLVREMLEDSGLLDSEVIKSFNVRENPFSDEVDVYLEFHPDLKIGTSEYENLVDDIWSFLYNSLKKGVSIRSNWRELKEGIKNKKILKENSIWLKRRKEIFDEMLFTIIKEFLSRRNFEDYTKRVNMGEFVDVVLTRLFDDIDYKLLAPSGNYDMVNDEELYNFLETNYSEGLKELWLKYHQ